MLALSLLFESWTVFILGWIPFYSWLRLIFLLYLALPQTQGAKLLYLGYVEPYIVTHENEIDRFIGEAHAKLQSVGLGYLSIIVEYIRDKVLGQAPPQQSKSSVGTSGYSAQASSYASDLLSRFAMPSARTNAAPYQAQIPGGIASFLGSALAGSQATGTRSVSSESHGQAGSAIPDLATLQSYLSSPATSNSQKTDLIQSQRDRLTGLLKALDKEQQTLDLAYGSSGNTRPSRPSSSGSGLGPGLGSKSRSEQSFEQVSYDEVHSPGSSHSLTPQQSTDRAQAKRTTSGGWAGAWFGGSPNTKDKDDDAQDLVSKGWSAARDMTEAVISSGVDRDKHR